MRVALLAQAFQAVEGRHRDLAQIDGAAVGVDGRDQAFLRYAHAGQLRAIGFAHIGGRDLQVGQVARAGGAGRSGGQVAGFRIDREHLNARTRRVHGITVIIDRKGAVAGIADGAVLTLDGEEAFAGDGEVQRLVGGFDRALRELLGDALHAHALAGHLMRGLHGRGGEDVAELRLALLEGGGVHVGDVVGDGGQVGLRALETGKRNIEGHGVAPWVIRIWG